MIERRIEDIPIKEHMNEHYITCKPEDTLSDALNIMRKHDITELPIIENRKLVGLVSQAILTRRRKLPLSTLVENIMFSPPKITPKDSLARIAEILMLNDFRAIPVIENKQLVGVISRQDVLRVIQELPELMDTPVTSIMNPLSLYVYETDVVSKALHRMKELDERTIPVLDHKDDLVGMLGLKDILPLLEEPRKKASVGEVSGEKISPNIEVRSMMSSPAISVASNVKVRDVVALMLEHNISSVPVTEDSKTIGNMTAVNLMELVVKHKEREECLVELAGLDIEDPSIYDAMYSIIQKYLIKINKMFKPRTLMIHVEHHHHENDLYKYTLRARLNTKKKLYVSTSFDWDIIKATDELMDHLERQIRKDHEKWHDLSRLRHQ